MNKGREKKKPNPLADNIITKDQIYFYEYRTY